MPVGKLVAAPSHYATASAAIEFNRTLHSKSRRNRVTGRSGSGTAVVM